MEIVMAEITFSRVLDAVNNADPYGDFSPKEYREAAKSIFDQMKEAPDLTNEGLAQIVRDAFDAHLDHWGQASLGYMLADLLH
jgi:hypothetical protein